MSSNVRVGTKTHGVNAVAGGTWLSQRGRAGLVGRSPRRMPRRERARRGGRLPYVRAVMSSAKVIDAYVGLLAHM